MDRDRKRLLVLALNRHRLLLLKKTFLTRRRRFGVHLICQGRSELGEFSHLMPELKRDEDKFFDYFRMESSSFKKLLDLIEPALKPRLKKKSNIQPEHMLALTVRYLATGNSFNTFHFAYRMGRATVGKVIRRTTSALINALKNVVRLPESPEEWRRIAEDFEGTWNFPNAVGAIDGKHIHIKKPKKTGSLHYNYKTTFSSVLLAVCDANYRVIYFKTGDYGSSHDSHVLEDSSFGKKLQEDSFSLPEDRLISGIDQPIPYFFLGDCGFPLRRRLMKPFSGSTTHPQAVFNYRLSRARRVIENVFGLLAARWRVLLRDIEVDANLADKIVACCVYLHNFLIDEASLHGTVDLDKELARLRSTDDDVMSSAPVQPTRATSAPEDAKRVRQQLVEYFMGEGSVPFQERHSLFY
uniref:DDE Tnp4 domain-containing protein n=1 Tax=Steinernema glaseri TaxID=37863 RepID=A0A1I7Y3U0_9BILA